MKFTNFFTEHNPNLAELIVNDNRNHSFLRTADEIWIATGYDFLQCEQLSILLKTKGHTVIKISNIYELIPISETLELSGYHTLINKKIHKQNEK